MSDIASADGTLKLEEDCKGMITSPTEENKKVLKCALQNDLHNQLRAFGSVLPNPLENPDIHIASNVPE